MEYVIGSFKKLPSDSSDSITAHSPFPKRAVFLIELIEKINAKEGISEIVNGINNNLTLAEKIKKFQLIDENFSIENGLLTPTMKVKRNKVIIKYKNILENFYKK